MPGGSTFVRRPYVIQRCDAKNRGWQACRMICSYRFDFSTERSVAATMRLPVTLYVNVPYGISMRITSP